MKLSRRRLLTASPVYLFSQLVQHPDASVPDPSPAFLLSQLTQHPGILPPAPGADTLENLTVRVTFNEWQIGFLLGVVREQGEFMKWVGEHLFQPGQLWPDEPRQT